MRISEGIFAIGQGRGSVPSVGGVAAGTVVLAKEAIRSLVVEVEGPSREWWAVFGTVTGAFDGFRSVGFILEFDGGKCLFL